MKALLLLAALTCAWTSSLRAEDTPATSPAVIEATDKEAITANEGKAVTVEGKIASAKWSKTGKVMNIRFEGSELLVAVFEKNKDKLNEQFNGDLGKTLTGAKIKLKGKLEVYKGKVESMQGKPQIVISQGSQITIEEAATTQPVAAE